MYIYTYIYIYIYIYTHNNNILSGPWKLSGRFRRVSVNVSSTLPPTFPLRFCWASACQTGVTQNFAQHNKYFVWPQAAEQIPSKTHFGTMVLTLSLNLWSWVRDPPGRGFRDVLADILQITANLSAIYIYIYIYMYMFIYRSPGAAFDTGLNGYPILMGS